ncbi:hypothetical protein TcBrA4_0050230 [Trypanosoma cruzi]|nr:hypothetical protein TcBrA4_0050230 [Trypanosoma cruzi]
MGDAAVSVGWPVFALLIESDGYLPSSYRSATSLFEYGSGASVSVPIPEVVVFSFFCVEFYVSPAVVGGLCPVGCTVNNICPVDLLSTDGTLEESLACTSLCPVWPSLAPLSRANNLPGRWPDPDNLWKPNKLGKKVR